MIEAIDSSAPPPIALEEEKDVAEGIEQHSPNSLEAQHAAYFAMLDSLFSTFEERNESYQIFREEFNGYESGGSSEYWFNDSLELVYYSESWSGESFFGETQALFESGEPLAIRVLEGEEPDQESRACYLSTFAPNCGRFWSGTELGTAVVEIRDCGFGEQQKDQILQSLADSKQAIIRAISEKELEHWESELHIILLDTLDFGGDFQHENQTSYEFTEAMISWFK